jgi:hypothetical protein
MFARVTIFREPADEAIRVTKDRVVPVVLSLPGSLGGFFLVNRKTGKTLSMTLWDTQHLDASAAPIAELRATRPAKVPGSELLDLEEYEVVLHPPLARTA